MADYRSPERCTGKRVVVVGGGISATHPGLVYPGLEFQRSFAPNTLRGVARGAGYVIPPLVAHVRGAPVAAGL